MRDREAPLNGQGLLLGMGLMGLAGAIIGMALGFIGGWLARALQCEHQLSAHER